MRKRSGFLEGILLGTVGIAALFAGCPRKDELKKEDFVIPDSGPGSAVSQRGNEYVLSAGGVKFSPGDVIVSGKGKGFIRKIESASKDNLGNDIYVTSQGTIAEAFVDGSLSTKAGNSKLRNSEARLIEWKDDFQHEIPLTENGKLIIDGNIFANLDLGVDLSVKNRELNSAKTTLEGYLSSDFDITALFEREEEFEKRIDIAEAEWVYATLVDGWFPFIMTVAGDADLVFEANATGKAVFYSGVGARGDIRCVAEFEDGTGWKRSCQQDIELSYRTAGGCMEGTIDASAYIDLNLEARLYGVIGPYFSLQPYLEFEGYGILPYDSNPKEQIGFEWTFTGGLNVPLGVNAEIFGEEIWDYSTDDVFDGKLSSVLLEKKINEKWPGGLISGIFNFGESDEPDDGEAECNIREQETNNLAISANRLRLCDVSEIRGKIDRYDIDYFIFSANAGEVLRFSSSPSDDDGGPSLIFDGVYVGPGTVYDPYRVQTSGDHILYGYQTINSQGARDYTITIERE